MPAAVVLVAAGATGLTAAVGGAVASAIVGGAVSATVATAVGTAVIAGTITAAQGGSASDVLKSAVLAGVTAGVASSISASIASDVAFQAIADGVSGTTAVAMGNVLGSAAAGAITSGISAGLSGRDPIEALIRGGLTAGLSSGVSSAVDAVFKDVPGFGPTANNAELALQRATKSALATSILGGSGTDAFEKSMLQSVAAVGGSYLGSAFRDLAADLKASYTKAQASETTLKENISQQQSIVDDYNSLSNEINTRYAQVTDARAQYDTARAKYDAMGGDSGNASTVYWYAINSLGYTRYGRGDLRSPSGEVIRPTALRTQVIDQVNAAANNYNTVVGGYNDFYSQNIDKITDYQNKLGALKTQYVDLEKDYVTAVDSLKTNVSNYSTQEVKNAALVQDLIKEIDDASEIYEGVFGRAPTTEEIKKLAATGDIYGSANKLTANLNTLGPDQKSKAVVAVNSGDIVLSDAIDNTPLDWLKLPSLGEFPDVVITGKKEPGWEHTVDDRGYTLMWNEGKGLIQLYDDKDNLLHNWTDQFKYDEDGNVVGRGIDYYLSSAQDSFLRSTGQVAALIGDVLPAMAAKAIGNETYFNKQMSEAKSTLDRVNRDYPSRVASYKNINDISSAATYVLESVVEGVVTTAPTLLMGGPAGVAARASAKAAMDAAIKRELAVQASKGVFGAEAIQAAQAAGTKAGLEVAAKFTTPAILTASAAQNVPEVFKNVYDAKQGKVDLKDVAISTIVGGFNAALDSVLPSAIVDRLNLSKIPVEQVIGAWYKNAAKEAGSAFLKEGGTEALQEMSSAAAESFLAENRQFFTKENLDRFIDAGIKGGLGGSAVSTAFTVGKDALGAPTGDDILSQGLDKTTPAEYLAASQMLKDAGFNATAKDIATITGAGPEVLGGDLKAQVDAYMDPRVVKESEAIQAFKDLGYTDPTPEEISAFIGQRDQASTLADLAKQYDPLATTVDEARQMMRDLGYTNFTDAEAMSLAGKIKEAEAKQNVEAYVNPRQVTRAEAEQYFKDIGYKPTEEEINQFIRSGIGINEQAVKSELGAYVDPRYVTEDEARQAYDALGLKKPTMADVQKLMGQYAETDLTGKATENLDSARYNSIIAQLDDLAAKQGIDPAVLETIKSDLNRQIEALGGDIDALKSGIDQQLGGISADIQAKYNALTTEQKALADQLRQQGVDLNTAINTATAQISANVQAKYDSLSTEQKALADALRQQGVDLNTAIETVRAQTQEQIGGLSADLQTKYNALTAEQKALANQLTQQGVDLNTAINTVAGQITADVQAKYDSLNAGQKALADQLAQQGVDLRTAINVAAQQTQQQVLDLGISLNQRVDQLVKQGMDQYTATQQAIQEVTQQNQQLQNLVGTQGRTATQSDIDALTQMLSGQRQVDLTYDVNRDNQITQDDLTFLQSVIAGTNPNWIAPSNTVWGGTGLYGQLAAAEVQRQSELKAQELQRQKDLEAQQLQRQKDLEAQAEAAREAERRSAIRSTAGQAGAQVQQIIGQLPQAMRGLQTTTTPIYGGEINPFDLSAPLDVNFFNPSKEKQGSQTGQQTTKIATGGYLDDLLDLLR